MIVNSDASTLLPSLSAKLKRKTYLKACQMDGAVYNEYTPWLCIRPCRDGLSQFSIIQASYSHGGLITDKKYLSEVSQLLNLHRDLSLDLLPGNPDEWIIYENIEEDGRDVIMNFSELIRFIKEGSPFFASIYDALVEMVIPMKQQIPQGFSNAHSRGAIFLSYPQNYNKISMALDFVHEMGHQALFLYQSVDPLIVDGYHRLVYSEIRRTERPAILSLHAATAIAFMLKFSKEANCMEFKHHDFEDSLSMTLSRAVMSLRHQCKFSAIGNRILDEFDELAN